MRPTCSRGAPSGERGIVLVVTLMFALCVLGLAVALTYTTKSSLDQQRRFTAKSRAVQAAESGMSHVVAALNGTACSNVLAAGGLSDTLAGDADSRRKVRYEVRLAEAGVDQFDNDFDDFIDEGDEQTMYEAVSVGYCDDTFVALGATIRLESPATIASATYLADPLAEVKLSGNSFRISGYDVDGSRVATGLSVPGIGVAGDPLLVRSQIRSQVVDNVEGSGAHPSVQQVPQLDLDELVASGALQANVVLSAGSATRPASPGAWGTVESPAIVYGQGDIHVSGGASGAGLLVVDGALTVSGSFEWWGLVIVRGNATFVGGGNGQRLTGALVVEKPTGVDAGVIEFPVGGTVDVLFSTEMIALAMKPVSRYTIFNWREAPVPPSVPKAWLAAGLVSDLSLTVEIAPISLEILPITLELPPVEVALELPPLAIPLLPLAPPPVQITVPSLPKLPSLKK